MTQIALELSLLFILIVANGVFAMTEIAIVSAKKGRLRAQADAGDNQARAALELAKDPNQFLSTVQIGITLIGIFAGAFGGATVAKSLAAVLEDIPYVGSIADPLSFLIVVTVITYFTLVVGELVPKRIGMLHPESLARVAARPMRTLGRVMSPFIWLLGVTSDAVLRLLRVQPNKHDGVTEEEVTHLIREGTRSGVFLPNEAPMVEKVLALDRIKVREIMTPRPRIVWLDAEAEPDETWRTIIVSARSRFPVYEDNPDRVLGFVSVKSLYANLAAGTPVLLRNLVSEPLYVSELQSAAHFLEELKLSRRQFALVTDEFGAISGLATLTDVTEAIFGKLPEPGRTVAPPITPLDEGGWSADGLVGIEEIGGVIPELSLLNETRHRSETLAGFVSEKLGRLPQEGDHFEDSGHRFEVTGMDILRVDKIRITPLATAGSPAPPPDK
ncbi:MAG: hemolysin family protein [Chthoniobacterales bacterium]